MKNLNWRYALGEIIIVIIGISIAFALNNWKASSAEAKIKKQYLEHLISDIEAEIEQLQANTEAFNQKLGLIQQIRPFLGNSAVQRDTLINKVFELARSVSFNPENTTYLTLINSGDLKLIDDFELRRSIEAHYAFHKIVLRNYERIDNIHEKYLGDFFIYHLDYKKLWQGDTSFLDNPLLSSIINSLNGAFIMVLNGNQACLERNEALLKEIQTELAN